MIDYKVPGYASDADAVTQLRCVMRPWENNELKDMNTEQLAKQALAIAHDLGIQVDRVSVDRVSKEMYGSPTACARGFRVQLRLNDVKVASFEIETWRSKTAQGDF